MDHNNPQHLLTKEANGLLAVVKAANMRHMPNHIPTWRSYGLHKVCKCTDRNCNCKRLQRSSCIDNVYVSLEAEVNLSVLEDSLTDHYPVMVKLKTTPYVKSKLESLWRRNISKMNPFEFETSLGSEDWSSIYDVEDPNLILDKILSNINSSLDKIAPMKLIKFRQDKPSLSLSLKIWKQTNI